MNSAYTIFRLRGRGLCLDDITLALTLALSPIGVLLAHRPRLIVYGTPLSELSTALQVDGLPVVPLVYSPGTNAYLIVLS